ncbi:unnamed protein product, partial [Tenebrio molitor]
YSRTRNEGVGLQRASRLNPASKGECEPAESSTLGVLENWKSVRTVRWYRHEFVLRGAAGLAIRSTAGSCHINILNGPIPANKGDRIMGMDS